MQSDEAIRSILEGWERHLFNAWEDDTEDESEYLSDRDIEEMRLAARGVDY